MRVTVLGAGVSGLTSALLLQRAGHDVRVIARERGLDATSGAAGAIWLPIRLGPGSRSFAWALESYRVFRDIAASHPAAGVDMITACEVVESVGRPWWAGFVDGLAYRALGDIYPHADGAWTFLTPRIEPALYLPWLESQLDHEVTVLAVETLDAVEGDIVVNCTGIGARRLCADAGLVPVFGQTVICEPGDLPLDLMLGDERNAAAIFYSIPRRADVVLGGCRIPVASDVPGPPDPVLTDAILARTRAAGYEPGRVLRVSCGLRPVRDEARLEREGRFVHNYGHGGSGFALSWGCAREVVDLVADHAGG